MYGKPTYPTPKKKTFHITTTNYARNAKIMTCVRSVKVKERQTRGTNKLTRHTKCTSLVQSCLLVYILTTDKRWHRDIPAMYVGTPLAVRGFIAWYLSPRLKSTLTKICKECEDYDLCDRCHGVGKTNKSHRTTHAAVKL